MSKVVHLPPADCSQSYQRISVKDVSIGFARWKRTERYRNWRRKQWAKQDARCYYCQCDLRSVRVNIEHVIPRSKGGSNRPQNLVLSCWQCNRDKGSTLLSPTQKADLHMRNLRQAKAARHAYRREAQYQEKLAHELSWIT